MDIQRSYEARFAYFVDDISSIEQEVGGSICCCQKNCSRCEGKGVVFWDDDEANRDDYPLNLERVLHESSSIQHVF